MRIKLSSIEWFKKLLGKSKRALLHRALWLTILSSSIFIIVSLIDIYVSNNFEVSYEVRQLLTVVFSLAVTIPNLIIIKKWLSTEEVGLQKKHFLRSLLYSLIYIVITRLFYYWSSAETIPEEFLTRHYFMRIPVYFFLAFQEELMFRGIIFKVWEKSKGFMVALYVSSILFGLEHLVYSWLLYDPIDVRRAFDTAFFSPIFILIAYRTKNIWGLTISHALYNISLHFSDSLLTSSETSDIFITLAMALTIFLPILIDYVDKKVVKEIVPAIEWSRHLAWLFIIFFALFAFFMISEDLGYSSSEQYYCPVIENELVTECIEEFKPSPENCWRIDLELDKAEETLKGNTRALEILENNCSKLYQHWFHDITGDGSEELAFLSYAANCDECKERKLFIMKDGNVIFETEKEDLWFQPAEDYDGFIIRYPLHRVGDPECCPTEGLMESYNTFSIGGDFVRFDNFDIRSEQYDR